LRGRSFCRRRSRLRLLCRLRALLRHLGGHVRLAVVEEEQGYAGKDQQQDRYYDLKTSEMLHFMLPLDLLFLRRGSRVRVSGCRRGARGRRWRGHDLRGCWCRFRGQGRGGLDGRLLRGLGSRRWLRCRLCRGRLGRRRRLGGYGLRRLLRFLDVRILADCRAATRCDHSREERSKYDDEELAPGHLPRTSR
jgi:hypothetical protein